MHYGDTSWTARQPDLSAWNFFFLVGLSLCSLATQYCQNEAENMRRNCQSPSTHVEPYNEEYALKVKGVLAQGWGELGDTMFKK